MNVIKTRYRNLTIDELKEVHACPPFDPVGLENWSRMAGKPIVLETPPCGELRCGQPAYRVLNVDDLELGSDLLYGKPTVVQVCSCIAELGD